MSAAGAAGGPRARESPGEGEQGGLRCLGLLLTQPLLLPGPRVDYYQVGGDDDDDDGNDHYDYDEDEFDGGWPFLDHPVAEGLIPYSYCGFRKSFLCSEPPPQLPRTSPTALDARLDRLPAPCRNWLTPEVGGSPAGPSCSPGAGGPRVTSREGSHPRGVLTQGIPPAGS